MDEGLGAVWSDGAEMRAVLDRHAVKSSGFSAHCPLMRPEISVPYLEKAIRFAAAVDSPYLRVNYDTGNAYLAGEDPYRGLREVLPLLAHVHAKDISFDQADAETGKTTGTPVGCACGEGAIDWGRVVEIRRTAGWNGVLSVECGTTKSVVIFIRTF